MALPSDFAARIRAARGYADMTRREFGPAVSVSATTIKNYEKGEHRPEERSSTETIRRLAKVSKLPEWFFTVPSLHGALVSGGSSSELSERIAALEAAIQRVEAALTRRPADAARPAPPGALSHALSDDRTTTADPEQTENPGAAESK